MNKGSANTVLASPPDVDRQTILHMLPHPVLVVGPDDTIRYVNGSAEAFFDASASHLLRQILAGLVPIGSPLLEMVDQVRREDITISEYELEIGTPRTGSRLVNINISPLADGTGCILLSLQEIGIATKMDRQLAHLGAGRMVSGMATVLAHEVKNPLSGIRGAAQLLEQNASADDQMLTRLICDETDRICALVDRMEMFSGKPLQREPLNIHRVLERVRLVAETGFARDLRLIERYDPSLPPVFGNFDQLVQVFMNLVKNAAEAAPATGGEVVLSTAYRHGVRMAMPGTKKRTKLPLEVIVQDNGEGVDEHLQPYLFDPFVTTKSGGTGLGLALVAKIIGDHGGIVECESRPRRTVFRCMLPIYEEPTA